jgi:hypothetical protein
VKPTCPGKIHTKGLFTNQIYTLELAIRTETYFISASSKLPFTDLLSWLSESKGLSFREIPSTQSNRKEQVPGFT